MFGHTKHYWYVWTYQTIFGHHIIIFMLLDTIYVAMQYV